MKVLWVGDQLYAGGRRELIVALYWFLERRGYEFEWCDLETEDPEAKIKIFQPDLVVAHFGKITRAEAAIRIRRFKSLGCKVVVYSVSRVRFEDADEVMPFIDGNGLVACVERLVGNKE